MLQGCISVAKRRNRNKGEVILHQHDRKSDVLLRAACKMHAPTTRLNYKNSLFRFMRNQHRQNGAVSVFFFLYRHV